MADRFVVVGAANVPYGGTPARRVGDKGGLWVIFDTLYGGPPSSSHASTILRSVAELHCRALNAYARDPRHYCGGDHCSQLWNLPCDDPGHRRPDRSLCPRCEGPTIGFIDRCGSMLWACSRCHIAFAPWR